VFETRKAKQIDANVAIKAIAVKSLFFCFQFIQRDCGMISPT